MRLNCGGESTRGCREESMLTKGLSAKGESKWVHIHVGNTKTAEGQIKFKKKVEHIWFPTGSDPQTYF
jgi:hypothetical protein